MVLIKLMNIKQRFFTIIIPLYNGEETIELTLESIFRQSYKNFEVIIYNDFSTDNSLSIVKNFIKKNNTKILIITSPYNKGTFFGWKKGIEKSNGEYIVIAPQDNIMANSRLNILNSEIIKNNYPSIITSNVAKGTLKNFQNGKGAIKTALIRYIKPSLPFIFLLKSSYFEFDSIVYKKSENKIFLTLEEFSPSEDFALVAEIFKINNEGNYHLHIDQPIIYKIINKKSQTYTKAEEIAEAGTKYILASDINPVIKFFAINSVKNILLFRRFTFKRFFKYLILNPIGLICGCLINFLRLVLSIVATNFNFIKYDKNMFI